MHRRARGERLAGINKAKASECRPVLLAAVFLLIFVHPTFVISVKVSVDPCTAGMAGASRFLIEARGGTVMLSEAKEEPGGMVRLVASTVSEPR